jgi:poly(A) polymerase/tRNA nucleotidyltransferase (CCA-adding enzyme)
MKSNIRSALEELYFLSDAYVVGGAVRDSLIGRESDDIDLATRDHPETVKAKAEFRGWNTVDTGIDHGTVTLLKGDSEYEVTTFRRDVSTDGRNATVKFATAVEEDLKRRDFTINAMAAGLDSSGNEFMKDPFGGIEDLINERIRAVGDPKTRFREDLLRIVRAFRFAARYGFEIGEPERSAIEELSGEVVENVSPERITAEIEKAMKSPNPHSFIAKLVGSGILADYVEPLTGKIRNPENFIDIRDIEKPEDRMAIFLWELKNASLVDWIDLRNRLRLSTDQVNRAREIGQLLFLLGDKLAEHTRRKILASHKSFISAAQRIARQTGRIPPSRLEKPAEVPLEPVATGKDFLDAGFEEGPQIGDLIEKAHAIQLEKGITDSAVLVEKATFR